MGSQLTHTVNSIAMHHQALQLRLKGANWDWIHSCDLFIMSFEVEYLTALDTGHVIKSVWHCMSSIPA